MNHPGLATELTRRLKLKWPLIQAPLAGGPSTPEIVSIVSNSGGLGSFGAAYLTPKEIDLALLQIKTLTNKSYGVNLFAPAPTPKITEEQIQSALTATRTIRSELHLPDPMIEPPYHEDFHQQFAVVLKHRPAVFSFTFGLVSRDIIDECRQQGIMTMGTATTLDEGMALQELGVDAVIAQGVEAGGHRGMFTCDQVDLQIGTFDLTRLLATELSIPIVASGGIMNGEGIVRALRSGAQAAHLGTAFLACDEAGTSVPYREALLNPKRNETRLTNVFSGRRARGIENRFMIDMAMHENSILPFPAQNKFTRDIRKRAMELNRAEFMSLWAGLGVELIRKMKTADLMEALYEEVLLVLDND